MPKQLGQIRADHDDRLALARPARRSGGRSRPSSRRRSRGSARRAAGRRPPGAAAGRAPPSAGCRPRARRSACAGPAALTRSRVHPARRLGPPPPQVQPAPAGVVAQGRVGQVVLDRPRQGEPFPLAVLAQEPEPLRDPSPRARRVIAPIPLTRTSPERTGSRPKIARSSSVRPAPTRPGDAQDLAPTERQVGPLRARSCRASPSSSRTGSPGVCGDAREHLGQVAADHRRDDRRQRRPRHRPRGDRRAVAEHGVSLGDPADFLEEMADVDDRQPPRPQPVDHREQPLGVALGQRAGRLVEDDHPGVRDQGPGDLDELLRADAQRAGDGVGPDLGMLEQLERLGDQPAVLAAPDQAGRRPAPGRA